MSNGALYVLSSHAGCQHHVERAVMATRLSIPSRCRLAIGIAIALSFAQRAAASPPTDPLAAVRAAAERVRDKSMRLSMKIVDAGGPPLERSLHGFEKLGATGRKVLWLFDSPNELAGTRFLMWDEAGSRGRLWVYFPAQRRVRQVADDVLREHFEGSALTYEDLTTVFYFDYGGTDRWLRDEACGSGLCDVVETTPAPGRISYRRVTTWLRRDLPLPDHIELVGERGTKTVHVLDTAVVDDIPLVVGVEARDDSDRSSTTIRYEDIHCNRGLTDDLFSLDALSHGR